MGSARRDGEDSPQLMTSDDIDRVLKRISHEIVERHHGAHDTVLLGIRTRGVPLAQSIASAIADIEGLSVPVGSVDVGSYRDDALDRRSRHPAVDVAVALDDHRVVLVDDVLYTGRTVRAAMDAVSDVGRASVIELAVLIDRGHRELPIRPDYVGKNVPTSRDQHVAVLIPPVDRQRAVILQKGVL